MKLLLVRHGVAEDRDEFAKTGAPDEQRPLTQKGRKRMKRAARGLASLVGEVHVLASSPLTRAQQTAEVIASAFDDAPISLVEALRPEQPFEAFMEWLRLTDDADVVLAVGHEPHLGGLAGWLLGAGDHPPFEFKKGGAALIEFDHALQPGAARLRWLLEPGQLRALET
jgi:phosphohistidine phosphatase